MRLKSNRKVNFQIQFRQSIFIVLICYNVEIHENTRGEYIRQHRNIIASCFIRKSCVVLQFMQVINKQRNGIKHEYMIHVCNFKHATQLLLPCFTKCF